MIIQFSHNGKEINLTKRSKKHGEAYAFDEGSTTKGIRFWNDERHHKRKYICQRGWYLENLGDHFASEAKEGDIYFWGEWEPASRFKLTGNPYRSAPSLPHAVHYPFFSDQGKGIHNTDPFVFGEHFYYTNCKQKKRGQGEMLLSLTNGSIIIFGSERARSEFVIDTVFVVESSETVREAKQHIAAYPELLREATLELHGGLMPWQRLYQGKMYDSAKPYSDTNPYPFCFVPCQVNAPKEGFERPVINWVDFGFKKPGAGTVLYQVKRFSDEEFWYKLVTELILQGFSLGIQLTMPKWKHKTKFKEYPQRKSTCQAKDIEPFGPTKKY